MSSYMLDNEFQVDRRCSRIWFKGLYVNIAKKKRCLLYPFKFHIVLLVYTMLMLKKLVRNPDLTWYWLSGSNEWSHEIFLLVACTCCTLNLVLLFSWIFKSCPPWLLSPNFAYLFVGASVELHFSSSWTCWRQDYSIRKSVITIFPDGMALRFKWDKHPASCLLYSVHRVIRTYISCWKDAHSAFTYHHLLNVTLEGRYNVSILGNMLSLVYASQFQHLLLSVVENGRILQHSIVLDLSLIVFVIKDSWWKNYCLSFYFFNTQVI